MDETGFKRAFGKRLRFLRELRHLTQSRLAERIGVTEQYISMLERGLSAPSFSLVAQLSQTLHTHPAALFLFPKLEGGESAALPVPTLPENLSQVAHCLILPGQNRQVFSPELLAWLEPAAPARQERPVSRRPVQQSLFAHLSREDSLRVQQALQDAAEGHPAPLFSFALRTAADPRRILAYATQQPDGCIRVVLMDVTDHLRLKQTQLDLQAAVEALAEERTQQLQETVARLEEEIRCRQESDEARTTAEARWRVLFEHAPVGIFQSLPEGRFQAVNREALSMFGYDNTEELLALDDIGSQIYVSPEERARLLEVLARDGAVEDFETEMKTKDGRVFRAAVTARPLPHTVQAESQPPSIIGFIKDLSPCRKARSAPDTAASTD
ncbi:helix-turn-helix domain-containing protein [Megalodesulfovibrio paquesii]